MSIRELLKRAGIAAIAAATTTLGALAVTTLPASAAAVDAGGTGLALEVTPDLACSVGRSGQAPAFRCATLVAHNGVVYGPAAAAGAPSGLTVTPYELVSQSGPSGTGTATDPYRITTIVELGATGVRIVQTDRMVASEGRIETDYRLRTSVNTAVTLYRVGDCDGMGTGTRDELSSSVTCSNGTGAVLLQPTSPEGHSVMGSNSAVWSNASTGSDFDDSCTCGATLDHGLGLSWAKVLTSGDTVGAAALTQLLPDNTLPLMASAVAPIKLTHPFASESYEITIRNPTDTARTLNSINVVVATNVRYITGSVAGEGTPEPTVSGRTLTWAGPLTVPANGSYQFSFKVRTPDDAGNITIDVTAEAEGALVSPARYTATMRIGGPSSTLSLATFSTTSLPPSSTSSESTSLSTTSSATTSAPTSSSTTSSILTSSSASLPSTTESTAPSTEPSTAPPTQSTSQCVTTTSSTSTALMSMAPASPCTVPVCTPGQPMQPGMALAPGCGPGTAPVCIDNPNMPVPTGGGCVPACSTNPNMAANSPRVCGPTVPATSTKPAFTGSRPWPLSLAGLACLTFGLVLAHRNRPKHRRTWWSAR